MSAVRVVRRFVIPAGVGLGVTLPIIFPSINAKEKPLSRMIRPSELPIYDEPEDIAEYEYYYPEPTYIEKSFDTAGQKVQFFLAQYQGRLDRAVEIYETGKAHTQASIDYLLDEENIVPRYSAIAVGGLVGLLLSLRKGKFKKLLYTGIGTAAVASAFYPQQAYEISSDAIYKLRKYGHITYNFIEGVKPQGREKPPSPPTIDVIAEQVSDVGYWGFRFQDTGKPSSLKSSEPEQMTADVKQMTTEESRQNSGHADILKTPLKQTGGDFGQSNPEDRDLYTTRGG